MLQACLLHPGPSDAHTMLDTSILAAPKRPLSGPWGWWVPGLGLLSPAPLPVSRGLCGHPGSVFWPLSGLCDAVWCSVRTQEHQSKSGAGDGWSRKPGCIYRKLGFSCVLVLMYLCAYVQVCVHTCFCVLCASALACVFLCVHVCRCVCESVV